MKKVDVLDLDSNGKYYKPWGFESLHPYLFKKGYVQHIPF